MTHKAEAYGYHPQVILAGRRINDGMGGFVASETVKNLLKVGRGHNPVVTVLGITFKENVPDFRNTKVVDIISELKNYGIDPQVHDPLADPGLVHEEYGVALTEMDDLKKADAVIFAVSHREYLEQGWTLVSGLLKDGKGVVTDVRNALDRETVPEGISLWRL